MILVCPGSMRLVTGVAVFLTLGTAIDAEITQPNSMEYAEGKDVKLPCSHSTIGGSDYIHWYRQNPNQSPQHIIRGLRNTVKNTMASLIIATDRKSSTLFLPQVTLRDSAVYYCSVSGGNNRKLIWGVGTTLAVNPNITDPDPAVYQLRSPQSNIAVCLFTDFDSETNVSQAMEPSVFSTNQTALYMRATDSKSNGALFWSNSSDFECQNVTPEGTFYSSSDIPCDATLVEKSFQTDINLNFQNLSVIGFRILLLKVVGFNLLMTLRLWSS